MQNIDGLAHLMQAVIAAPEKPLAWLKDFDTKPVGVTVKMKALPQHRNDFLKAFTWVRGQTIEQEGEVAVPLFKLSSSPFDDHVFYLVEEWASAAALRRHFVSGYMARLVQELQEYLVPSSESPSYVAFYGLGSGNVSSPEVHASGLPPAPRSAEPMQNIANLSALMQAVVGAPDNTPPWLKGFRSCTKPIGITVKFKALPQRRNDFVKAMKTHQRLTAEREGEVANPLFKLHTSPFDQSVFYLVEEWASASALRKHFVSDYMAHLVEELKAYLVPSSESPTYVAFYNLGYEEK